MNVVSEKEPLLRCAIALMEHSVYPFQAP